MKQIMVVLVAILFFSVFVASAEAGCPHGHHGGYYGGGYYGGGYRAYYPPPAVYYPRPVTYGYGYGPPVYRSGFSVGYSSGFGGYPRYYGGGSGVFVGFRF
ncbi:MAG: hypothetical protein KDA99_19945 [Planctomycetales bacterium]|nr:hypothetical protein [Planctomycetales bacterium]